MRIFIFFFVKQMMESHTPLPVLSAPTPPPLSSLKGLLPISMAFSFSLCCCRGFPFRFVEPFPHDGFVSSLLLFHVLLW